MSTIAPTVVKATECDSVNIVTWVMGIADTGVAVNMADAADRCVQITGTFGGATVLVEGSNDGTNYATLSDPQGNAISKTSAGIEQIEEVTRYIRCSTSGGSGSTITVTLLVRGMKR